MIKRKLNRYLILTLALFLDPLIGITAVEYITTKSPDGNIELRFFIINNHLNYSVSFMGKPVIETSPMSMLVDGINLCSGVKFGKTETYKINEEYPTRGVH